MLYGINNESKIFKKPNNTISKTKINYFSSHTWRLMYLINSNSVYNTLTKKIYNSSSTIPHMFIGYEIFIYSGLKWASRTVNRWSIGFKFGILTWNRKLALFKAKQLKKK